MLQNLKIPHAAASVQADLPQTDPGQKNLMAGSRDCENKQIETKKKNIGSLRMFLFIPFLFREFMTPLGARTISSVNFTRLHRQIKVSHILSAFDLAYFF